MPEGGKAEDDEMDGSLRHSRLGILLQRIVKGIRRGGRRAVIAVGRYPLSWAEKCAPGSLQSPGGDALLNRRRENILCVRGNCDAEVDQMVLEFPIMAEYCILCIGDRTIYATHGHVFGEQNPPPLHPGDILLCGHTHVPRCAEHGHYIYMNPGSVSIPKEGSSHRYMTIDEKGFLWKDFTGKVFERYPLRQGSVHRGRYNEAGRSEADIYEIAEKAKRHIRAVKEE